MVHAARVRLWPFKPKALSSLSQAACLGKILLVFGKPPVVNEAGFDKRDLLSCCADVADDATLLVDESPQTCDQLGWLNGAVASHACSAGRVAGAADTAANSTCIAAAVSFRQAEQLCFDYGARLCDTSELKDRRIVTDECTTEQAAGMWTRTSCPGGFQILPWDRAQSSQCVQSDQTADVMCCADDDVVPSELSCSVLPLLRDYDPAVSAWTQQDNVCFSRSPARNAVGELKAAPTTMAIGDALATCTTSFARSCSSAELSAFALQVDATFATSSQCTTAQGTAGQVAFNPSKQTLTYGAGLLLAQSYSNLMRYL